VPVFARYQVVLREPHVGRLLITAMIARLPQGMSGLAVILFLTPRLGYGRAGVATGVSVATAGLSNIVLARAVDRIGARAVLGPSAVLYAAAIVALALNGSARYGVQLAICGVIGVVTPPITSVSRAMWSTFLTAEQATVIYGLEATAQELIFITGPAGVALLAGLSSAKTALVASGVIGLVGAFAYISAPPFSGRPIPPEGQRHHVLRGTRVLNYAGVGMCLVGGFSITEISTVAFVGGHSASARAGVVIALWSAGSLLGGVLFGAANSVVTDALLTRAVTVVGGGLGLAALAPNAVVLTVILFAAGVAVAPTLARLYGRMGQAAGEASKTEAFGWLAVGFLVGSSGGSALGGVSVDGIGARWTFLIAAAVALCAVPIITVRRTGSVR
jgi:hypothetical protein